MRVLYWLGLIALLPAATAAGTIDLGAATVDIEDRRGTDCSVRTGSLCQADAETNGPVGDWDVDTNQEVDHATVRVRYPTPGPAAAFAPLLPSEELKVDFTQTRIPHPVFILLDEHVFPRHFNVTYQDLYYDVTMSAGKTDLRWNGPSALDPLPPWEHKVLYDRYASDPDGVHYDYIGTFNLWANTTTDRDLALGQHACRVEDGAACEVLDTRAADRAYHDATPNVKLGLDYYAVTASTAPPGTHESGTAQATATSDDLAFERAPDQAATSAFTIDEAATPQFQPRERAATVTAAAPDAHTQAPTVSTKWRGAAAPSNDAQPPWLAAAAGTSAAFLLFTFIALYRRLTRQQLLTQTTREKLLAFVRANPGARTADVARRLNVDRKAVDYHVKMLTKDQIVVTRVVMRQKRLFVNGDQPDSDVATLHAAVLDHPVAAAIAATVKAAATPLTRQDLLSALPDVAPSTLDFHANRLAKAGVLARGGHGFAASA